MSWYRLRSENLRISPFSCYCRYDVPPSSQAVESAQFTSLSSGGRNPFFQRDVAPLAGTEAEFTASCIGCTYYVVVAWIWSIIWYFGLVSAEAPRLLAAFTGVLVEAPSGGLHVSRT